MKKFKVLYVEHQGALGGATLLLLQMLEVLDRDRYEPIVVYPRNSDPFFNERLDSLDIKHSPLPLYTWSKRSRMPLRTRLSHFFKGLSDSRMHLRTIRMLQRLVNVEHVDLVHTNSASIIDGAIAAKWSNVPHVWHIREHVGKQAITEFLFGNILAMKLTHKLSSRMVAMSHFIMASFHRYGLGDKVQVVYEYIEPELLAMQNGFDLKLHLGFDSDKLVVGMVANGTSWKRHSDLIKVAKHICPALPQVEFVMIGSFPQSRYRKDLETLLRGNNLEGRVRFAGPFPRAVNFYQGIDILLHPTVNEPFGMAVVEAMAAGIPVVATLSGGPAESVVHGETGFLVPAYDVEALASAVRKLIESKELRRKMGELGRRRARAMFGDPERFAREIQSIYESVLESRSGKPGRLVTTGNGIT